MRAGNAAGCVPEAIVKPKQQKSRGGIGWHEKSNQQPEARAVEGCPEARLMRAHRFAQLLKILAIGILKPSRRGIKAENRHERIHHHWLVWNSGCWRSVASGRCGDGQIETAIYVIARSARSPISGIKCRRISPNR